MRSSLPQENGSLLDDKDSDQDAASQEEDLGNCEVSASGGALGTSFSLRTLGSNKIRTQHL